MNLSQQKTADYSTTITVYSATLLLYFLATITTLLAAGLLFHSSRTSTYVLGLPVPWWQGPKSLCDSSHQPRLFVLICSVSLDYCRQACLCCGFSYSASSSGCLVRLSSRLRFGHSTAGALVARAIIVIES